MSETNRLIEVPEKFLDQKKWAQVRAFASSNLEALTYLNAPYPESAADFFWNGRGSASDARRCYRLGKSLVSECRSRFIAGELVAIGYTRNGIQERIPQRSWIDLYPMFATDRIIGRAHYFTGVRVSEGTLTQSEQVLRDCISWLKDQISDGNKSKKRQLEYEASVRFPRMTKVIFNAAYKVVLDYSRGRPWSN